MAYNLYFDSPNRRPPVLSAYDADPDSMKTLAEHWLVYPMGDHTPAKLRGKPFALNDVAGVKAYHAAAVAVGYEPKVTLCRKVSSPSSDTPTRFEILAHIDRVGTDLSGHRRCLIDRPADWPTYRAVHVDLGGGRLRSWCGESWAREGRVGAASRAVRDAQPLADVTVDLTLGAPTHTYSAIREDGTKGTQDDSDVREVVGKILIYVFWEHEMHLLRKTLPAVRRR